MRDEEWFKAVCEEFENQYGFGWKKKLADVVGVSASNVQSWIKAGRVPPAVATAITKNEEIEDLKRELSILNINSKEIIIHFKGEYLPYKVAVKNEKEFHHEIVAGFRNEIEAYDWLERQERESLFGELTDILVQRDCHDDPFIEEKVRQAKKLLTSALKRKREKLDFQKNTDAIFDCINMENFNKENKNGE